jgi:NADH dehydrogenase (ubiquinone) Fe-S protein 6
MMLSTARSRAVWQLSRRAQVSARRAYPYSANDKQEINNPNPTKNVPNVSKSNELPIETSHQDARIQESVEDAEKLRVQQAPNRVGVWSRSQNPRAQAMTGPRFEQTIMELQVRGVSSTLWILMKEFFFIDVLVIGLSENLLTSK